ncbi:hypothetical protein Hdeb2414_s0014g00431901 [Helianthus debilis subsp. tardiflorus]
MGYKLNHKTASSFTKHLTKLHSFSPSCPYPRPNTHPHPSSLSSFDQAILHTYKCEGVHTRKLGAYGLPRTSLRRYYPPIFRLDSSLALS